MTLDENSGMSFVLSLFMDLASDRLLAAGVHGHAEAVVDVGV